MTIHINAPLVESKNIFEVHSTGTQTEDLAFQALLEEFERVDDDHIIGKVEVVDDKIIVQEEIIDPSVSSDEQIIVQDEIIAREEIMEPEMEEFVEELLQETDVISPICEGTGRDYFHEDCALCDGIGKLLEYVMRFDGMPASRRWCMPSATRNPSPTG